MTGDFWSVIADAGAAPRADSATVVDGVRERLAASKPAAISAFQDALDDAMEASYGTELWGAAYLLFGGCSDDGFEYFRGWLLTRGEQTFTAAISDPDGTLAELPDDAMAADGGESEDILYVAARAYQDRTGQPMPRTRPPLRDIEFDFDPDDRAEMARRYPRLSAALA